uniref:Uncharacterized protein n=1 Tax=Glossina palpalis gambiensis TaxID=67801 RepID=A0A1B0BAK6_9MUSC
MKTENHSTVSTGNIPTGRQNLRGWEHDKNNINVRMLVDRSQQAQQSNTYPLGKDIDRPHYCSYRSLSFKFPVNFLLKEDADAKGAQRSICITDPSNYDIKVMVSEYIRSQLNVTLDLFENIVTTPSDLTSPKLWASRSIEMRWKQQTLMLTCNYICTSTCFCVSALATHIFLITAFELLSALSLLISRPKEAAATFIEDVNGRCTSIFLLEFLALGALLCALYSY